MNPSFAPLSLKITAQHVGRIINSVWGRLTKPASSIQEPERRRQAQLLSSLLLLVLIIVLVAPIRATAGILWQDFSTPVSIVAIVTLVGVYGLSRTKHYGTSATMTIAILFALIHLAPFFVDRGEQVLFYAVLPILLSSLLFSLRAVFGVAIASIGTMLLLISLVPQAEINTYTAPVIFTLIISAALVTFIRQRDLLTRDQREVLHKSESECRLLLEHASDGISVADRQGNYIKVNSTLCQMLGYPREEFLQLNVRDIIPPEDLVSTPLRFDELYAGKLILIERRLRCKDGTLLPVEISAKILDDGRLQAIVRDIGERKQVEEALRESQTFLEKAQEVGHIGSWKSEMAMEGALTWSKEIYRIFGIAEDQFDGKVETFFNYIYPDDLEAVKAASQAAFANDVPYNIEHRIVRPDGSVRWVHERADVLRDETGAPLRMIGIIQDITERKQAEEALRRYTERLKDLRAIDQAILAASSLEAIAESAIAHIRRLVPCLKASLTLFDLEAGTFIALAVHMNGDTKIKPGISFPLATSMMKRLVQGQVEVVEDILSLSPLPEPLQHLQAEGIRSYITVPLIAQSELIGSLNLLAGRPGAFSEQDIEIACEVADQLALAIKHARLYEQVQRHAAELEQRVAERTAQLEATNKVLENEIAERKQAENTLAAERNLLRTLIDNLPDYIYVKDTESRFMTNNMAHMHLMGATRLGEIVGKTDFDLFPAKLARQYYADDQAVIRSCQPLFNREELTISETDDSLKWVSTTKVPLWDSQGKVMGLVGITRDISQRKQAEEAIKQLNEDLNGRAIQLEAANKELEAFSYSVSHDLRAPLRAIDGFSQALLEDYAEQLDEAGQDHLQRVRAATQRMGQLIDDMLDLSRITRSELRRQQVNLSALAAMIAWELRQTQLERQVEFVIAPGVTAEGDPQLLRVALENLLSNAWKFTQKQPQATIEFGVTQHQGQLTYFVRDDGVGFDMAYADKLFGPFQRLHARNEFEGTGIGLATVQRIIQRHGGKVWAEATVGKGATFFFTLL